jgi:hypothetical protein
VYWALAFCGIDKTEQATYTSVKARSWSMLEVFLSLSYWKQKIFDGAKHFSQVQ